MEAEWVALAVSALSLVVSALTMWSHKRRVKRRDLLELHEALRQLEEAALDHLDAGAGQYPTENDVRGFRRRANILAEYSQWNDVRDAAERVIRESERVLAAGVREAPVEQRDEIREAITRALDAAGATIGARVLAVNSVRGLVRDTWRRARRSA